MADKTFYTFKFPINTDIFLEQTKLSSALGKWDGLTVTRNATSYLYIDVGPGWCVMPNGTVYLQEASRLQVGFVSPTAGLGRRDAVVVEFYLHADQYYTAELKVIPGTPAVTPVLPAISADQMLLAEIYMPSSSTEINPDNITNAKCVPILSPGKIKFAHVLRQIAMYMTENGIEIDDDFIYKGSSASFSMKVATAINILQETYPGDFKIESTYFSGAGENPDKVTQNVIYVNGSVDPLATVDIHYNENNYIDYMEIVVDGKKVRRQYTYDASLRRTAIEQVVTNV